MACSGRMCHFFFGGRPGPLRVMKCNSRRKTDILSIFMMHFQVKLTITHVILKTSSFNEITVLFSSPLYEQLWTRNFHRSTQNSKIKATEKNARAKKNAEKKEFKPPLGKVGGARPRYGGRAGARARARARAR